MYKFFGLSTSSWIDAAGFFGILLVWKCVAGLWIAIGLLKPSPQGQVYDITADCHVRHVGTQPFFSEFKAENFQGLQALLWFQALRIGLVHPLQYNAQSHSSMYVYLILYYIAFFNHAIGGSRNESRTPRWRKLFWPVRGGCAGNLMRKAEWKDWEWWICELLEVRGSGNGWMDYLTNRFVFLKKVPMHKCRVFILLSRPTPFPPQIYIYKIT